MVKGITLGYNPRTHGGIIKEPSKKADIDAGCSKGECKRTGQSHRGRTRNGNRGSKAESGKRE